MDTREIVATTVVAKTLVGMFTPRVVPRSEGPSVVLTTNAEQVHLAALVRHRDKTLDDVLAHNKHLIDLFDEVEQMTGKSVWLTKGLTAAEVIASGQSLLSDFVIVTGELEGEPTYSIARSEVIFEVAF